MSRIGFLLTVNEFSERTVFSKKILEKIGFDVKIIQCIPNENKLLSNRLSMQYIYGLIIMMQDDKPFYYVFEDDVNMIEDINIDEIIQYEAISEQFFYLGCCVSQQVQVPYILQNTNNKINGHDVYNISGNVFGLHAIGMSKKCTAKFLEFINNEQVKNCYNPDFQIDVLLGQYTNIYPANVVRFDLFSNINIGHRGILFQDQIKFPSSIK